MGELITYEKDLLFHKKVWQAEWVPRAGLNLARWQSIEAVRRSAV